MAAMASRRTASAIAASSSLSSSDTICRLKVPNSESSAFSWTVRSSASCFELAMRFFSFWISRSVAQTFSLRSSSSFSKSSILWELAEVSALASRAPSYHWPDGTFLQYRLSKRLVNDVPRSSDEPFPLWPERKGDVRPARA